MLKGIAKFVSVIFHPLLMPTYAFALMLWANPFLFTAISWRDKLLITGGIFINTFILPLVLVLILQRLRLIKSLEMNTKEERLYPFVLTAMIYGSVFYHFKSLSFPAILSLILLTATITLILAFVISYKWKVSIHSIGIAGFAGIVYYNSAVASYGLFIPLAAIFLLAGIIGTARLALRKHNPLQIYAGYLLGWFSAVAVFWIMG